MKDKLKKGQRNWKTTRLMAQKPKDVNNRWTAEWLLTIVQMQNNQDNLWSAKAPLFLNNDTNENN